jgi:transcriptional regulator with XRE-family HTH domain
MARMNKARDPRYAEVVALLRQQRHRSGLSQFELAQRLGRPQSYISKIETCERRIDIVEMLEICQAIGIEIQEVIPSDFRTA